jgi:hypothetical protein
MCFHSLADVYIALVVVVNGDGCGLGLNSSSRKCNGMLELVLNFQHYNCISDICLMLNSCIFGSSKSGTSLCYVCIINIDWKPSFTSFFMLVMTGMLVGIVL